MLMLFCPHHELVNVYNFSQVNLKNLFVLLFIFFYSFPFLSIYFHFPFFFVFTLFTYRSFWVLDFFVYIFLFRVNKINAIIHLQLIEPVYYFLEVLQFNLKVCKQISYKQKSRGKTEKLILQFNL